jgi:replication-associated recombination protein RarA
MQVRSQNTLADVLDRTGFTFLMTAREPCKITAPVASRCLVLDLKPMDADEETACMQMARRLLIEIAVSEGYANSDRLIDELLAEHFPDFRKVLTALEWELRSGERNTGAPDEEAAA